MFWFNFCGALERWKKKQVYFRFDFGVEDVVPLVVAGAVSLSLWKGEGGVASLIPGRPLVLFDASFFGLIDGELLETVDGDSSNFWLSKLTTCFMRSVEAVLIKWPMDSSAISGYKSMISFIWFKTESCLSSFSFSCTKELPSMRDLLFSCDSSHKATSSLLFQFSFKVFDRLEK